MEYIGHTSQDGRKQLLIAHLKNTARLTSEFCKPLCMEEIGYSTGYYHDIGKYADEFQKYIRHNGSSPIHSTCGAIECFKNRMIMQAICIAGHHEGLPNVKKLGEKLSNSRVPDYKNFFEEGERIDFSALIEPFSENEFFHSMFMTRMLFSALVDADFLDTEAFMSDGKNDRSGYDSIEILCARLDQFLQKFSRPNNEINEIRYRILQECLVASYEDERLFSLTVPTGGGKTWSSMAFALHHAKRFNKERIIYVIPYTSIIEQTVDVFRSVFGEKNVLEHHSNVDYASLKEGESEDFLKLASENWDIPIIVTTNVQFFESLFAYKTSKCRKLHNIANSVIVFDEAQMLPIHYLKPCTRMISELIQNCRNTVLLCTATQPNLQRFFDDNEIHEIMQSPANLFSKLKRTKVEIEGKYEMQELVEKFKKYKQVLCIVNLKKQAYELYYEIDCEDVYHLSTYMTPNHRREVLTVIRSRLDEGLPCIVISTTVLEAGVDIDFPVVFREVSGLDSILQAAGRCNREGKRKVKESIVHVFEFEKVPEYIQRYKRALEETLRDYTDINSPEAIERYFSYLYMQQEGQLNSFDERGIIGLHDKLLDFEAVSKRFQIIENKNMKTVIVLRNTEYEQMQPWVEQLEYGIKTKELMRKFAPYSVNVYENDIIHLKECGAVQQISEDLYLMNGDIDAYYDKNTGIVLMPENGNAFFV